jgi:uncharacterized protein (TIGR00251 family)
MRKFARNWSGCWHNEFISKSMCTMLTIKSSATGLFFNVYVQPRASKAAIVGCHDDALKIKLTAPPVGGAANKQCIQILAKNLGLPKSAIAITSGQTSRMKQISLQSLHGDFTPAEIKSLEQILQRLAQPTP